MLPIGSSCVLLIRSQQDQQMLRDRTDLPSFWQMPAIRPPFSGCWRSNFSCVFMQDSISRSFARLPLLSARTGGAKMRVADVMHACKSISLSLLSQNNSQNLCPLPSPSKEVLNLSRQAEFWTKQYFQLGRQTTDNLLPFDHRLAWATKNAKSTVSIPSLTAPCPLLCLPPSLSASQRRIGLERRQS